MNIKYIYTWFSLFVFVCCTLNVNAQASMLSVKNDAQFRDRLTGSRLGLFADSGIYPGLKFGTSYILKEKEKTKKYLFKFLRKKRGSKFKIIQYLADANIGFYSHPNNHLGVFVGTGFTRMRTNTRKMRTLAWSFEVNYLRNFYNIPTLELDESGSLNELGGAGNDTVMFAIAPSFGKIFGTQKDKRQWHFYVKPSMQLLRHDFSFFLNASLEIGTTLNLFKKNYQGQDK